MTACTRAASRTGRAVPQVRRGREAFEVLALKFAKAFPRAVRGGVRADALGSVLQVHVGRFWGLLGWDTFLVSDLGWETGFGLLSPS